MGKRNTNFRKLYLVDESHYNSLQYGQVHDNHIKEVKSLIETMNRPQPPPIQNAPPPTQNVPPQQQDEPMDVDPPVNNPQQNLYDASTQTIKTNNPVPFPFVQPPASTQTINNPVQLSGFVQPSRHTPLGTAIQRIAGTTIPYLGPPLQPRLPQTNQNNNLQVPRFVGPSPSPQPTIQLPSSPQPPAAPLPLPGPSAPLSLTATSDPLPLPGPSATLALTAPPGPFAIPLPPPAPSGVVALQPLPPPPPSGVVAIPPLPPPPPRGPIPIVRPPELRALPAPAAAPTGPFAPAPEDGMELDPSRGTRRARSPDTVGANGSPILRRRRYKAIKPESPPAPTVPSEPSVGQQDVTQSNTLPSTRGRRARSEGDSSSTIDGRTARNYESPIRSRTPLSNVANDLGARRRTYRRILIDPDEEFLRQNSSQTQQQRADIVWFHCPICKTSFRSEEKLRKHVQRVHKEYLEQDERGEKRERDNQEYGRINQKNKKIA